MTPAHSDTNGAEAQYEHYVHELTDPGFDPYEVEPDTGERSLLGSLLGKCLTSVVCIGSAGVLVLAAAVVWVAA